MTPRPPSQDITRIALAVLFIGLIIFASPWVLWPLVAATVWATTIVVATLASWARGSRKRDRGSGVARYASRHSCTHCREAHAANMA